MFYRTLHELFGGQTLYISWDIDSNGWKMYNVEILIVILNKPAYYL